MKFKQLEYLNWARLHEEENVKYPLFGSGVKSLHINDLNKLGLKLGDIETAGTVRDHYGMFKLKEFIAGYYKVKSKNVTLTAGTSMAIFLAWSGLIDRGDEVIIEFPCYEPILKGAQALGVNIKRLPRRFSDKFQPDIADVKKLLTKRTKVIYLTSLHNPSGIKVDSKLISEIAKEASKVGAYVVVNEIYLDYLLDKTPPPAFKLADNIITMSSLTKVYGLGWIRGGWILANEELTKQFHNILDYFTGELSYPSQTIALFAFKNISRLRENTRKIVNTNLPIVRDFINSQNLIKWVEPDSGIISFPKLPDKVNAMELINLLKRKYDTLVVPGEFFESPGYIRLGFGCPEPILREGLRRLKLAVGELI
jgi:aspartate/methionine/tyrosine aminotransferase